MNSSVSELHHVDLRPLAVTLLLGLITILFLFWSSIRKQSYWKKIGIPYAKPYPFVGCILDNFKKPFQDVELERYQKYGKIYGHYEGNRALLSVGDLEILRHILVKDFHAFTGRRKVVTGEKITENMLPMLEGEDWKRVRRIVAVTFTTRKIKKIMNRIKECSRTLVKNIKEAYDKGEPVEVKRMYGTFSMDIIANCVFSTVIDSLNDSNKFVVAAKEVSTNRFNWRILAFLIIPRIMKYFKISLFPSNSLQFFSNMTLQIVEERKRTGQTRNDYLQLLMDVSGEMVREDKVDSKDDDDIAVNYGKEEDNEILKNYHPKKSLSQNELVAQCVIFFLGSLEPTASVLSFASYELALNPDIQEKLIQEIDEILRANDGELSCEAVQNMKYLDNVISETLRIYPHFIRHERAADEEYKLHGTGLTLPKGMIVTIPVYAIHRDPELFPDPEKFDPDRFSPEERAKRSQYSYMPFGAGPRNCVGMRFALIEAKVCLAHVLSHFRIKKCLETKVPLDFCYGSCLEAKNITLFMEERKDRIKSL